MGGILHLIMDFLSRCYYGFHKRTGRFFRWSCRTSLWRLHQFCLELLYLTFFSTLGFIALLLLENGKPASSNRLRTLDLFLMSVSAHTVSSLSSINTEDLSNSQFVVLIFLMFVGGEVFLSAVTLLFQTVDFHNRKTSFMIRLSTRKIGDETDAEMAIHGLATDVLNGDQDMKLNGLETDVLNGDQDMKLRSMRILANVALGFHMFVCIFGSLTVLAYFHVIASARSVLQGKGLNMVTFSVFTTVSSFVNCGLLPNNENMRVFNANSGFLLMVTGQILVGNTLFPLSLTLMIWALQKWSPREEYEYLWRSGHELGYTHLFPWKVSAYITLSNVGFTVLQFIMFAFLQWGSSASRLNVYQKVVAGLFQSVNARHAGEMAFDLSAFSAALLVVYTVMMFLPPYTFLLPLNMARPGRVDDAYGDGSSSSNQEKKRGGALIKYLLLPQAAYLVLFVVLVCLTERSHLREDPLNFNVLTIAFEVASAYGNVGMSIGYSCERLHKISDIPCTDTWASFAGRWSWKGKIVITVVMFFGRLKKFASGGKAWVALL